MYIPDNIASIQFSDIIQALVSVVNLFLVAYIYFNNKKEETIEAWQDLLKLHYDPGMEPMVINKYIQIHFHPAHWDEVREMTALDITVRIMELANEPVMFPALQKQIKYRYKRIRLTVIYYTIAIAYAVSIIM